MTSSTHADLLDSGKLLEMGISEFHGKWLRSKQLKFLPECSLSNLHWYEHLWFVFLHLVYVCIYFWSCWVFTAAQAFL